MVLQEPTVILIILLLYVVAGVHKVLAIPEAQVEDMSATAAVMEAPVMIVVLLLML
jgi:hypothetical protein